VKTAIVKIGDRIFRPTEVSCEDTYFSNSASCEQKIVKFYIVLSVHCDKLKLQYTNRCTTVQSMDSFYCLAATCFGVITFFGELTQKYY